MTMSEHKSSCPGCASAVPPHSIAFKFQLECPACLASLRVPFVYQANFLATSLVLGLIAANFIGAGPHMVEVTFGLAFVFACFLGTTIVPLVPPKLERR